MVWHHYGSSHMLACWMAINEGKKRQIIPDDFVDLLLWAVPLGYVGARIIM